ncbi:MAG TPA: tetratricopeptide repeat protein [Polyangia bacterium]|jgi:tetratricopeptide (TPR) repeat protein|nr:tetratricopeptide repeat protein [Polyangia bacterium]
MTYGALLSSKLISEGKFQEAVEAASQEISLQPDEPEAYFNRGQARVGMDQLAQAVADYQRALTMNASDSAMDPEAVDDELFFALRTLATQRQDDPAASVATLREYVSMLPHGRHVEDVAKWIDKLRGVETVWYRERA